MQQVPPQQIIFRRGLEKQKRAKLKLVIGSDCNVRTSPDYGGGKHTNNRGESLSLFVINSNVTGGHVSTYIGPTYQNNLEVPCNNLYNNVLEVTL